jgi:hypothetical protein
MDDHRWLFLLTTILTLPATFPLLRAGYFDSDDGWIHLYRLAALDRALHNGVVFPRWFPDFAFGYGYPVLNFYSPLSYYLAEAWHIAGANLIVAMKLTFATGFLLAAWAMYLFIADVMGPPAGVIAAIAYTYAPYHLADAYLRGALAEHLAFVGFPLILWALRWWIATRRRTHIVWLALGGAGLILTHNLSALIFAPVAAAYAILLLGQSIHKGHLWEQRRLPAGLLVALLLALALSAFYWLPALAESRYVHLALDFGNTGYRKHLAPPSALLSPFVLHRYFPEQGVVADHPLGVAQAFFAVVGLAGALIGFRRRGARRRPSLSHLVFALLITVGALFMTTVPSLPLWKLMERVLSVLQYPWRFMALVSLGTAWLTAGIANLLPESVRVDRRTVVACSLIIAVAMGFAGMAHLDYDAEPLSAQDVTAQRMWEEDYQHQQIGASWTAEYLPRWVRQERWAIPRPAQNPSTTGLAPLTVSGVHLEKSSPLGFTITVSSTESLPLSLHQFYFPGWKATVDGRSAATYPRGELGLVTVEVPAGVHRASFRFGDTPARRWGTWASLLTLAGLFVVALWWGSQRWRRGFAIALVLAGGLIAGHLLQPWASPPPATAFEGVLGTEARIIGYRTDRLVYHPGDTVQVTLYWLGLSAPETNYKVFVHLTSTESPLPLAQHDGDPVGSYTPTSRWLPGEWVTDRHVLHLSSTIAPGHYRLWAGMYDYATGKRLPISGQTPHQDRRLLLGTITIR